MEHVYMESRGVRVPAVYTPAEGNVRGAVLMLHGHGGSKDEGTGYIAIAESLSKAGIASVRFDQPGCGESDEPFTANRLAAIKQDAAAAYDMLCSGVPAGTPVGVLGYSMGGRAALELLADGMRFDAVCLIAPAADNSVFEAKFALREKAQSEGFVELTTPYGQVQQLSTGWFCDLDRFSNVDELIAGARAASGDVPAMVMWAGDDDVVFPWISERVAEELGARTVDLTGNGHSSGFYMPGDYYIKRAAADNAARFFGEVFCKE